MKNMGGLQETISPEPEVHKPTWFLTNFGLCCGFCPSLYITFIAINVLSQRLKQYLLQVVVNYSVKGIGLPIKAVRGKGGSVKNKL